MRILCLVYDFEGGMGVDGDPERAMLLITVE